MLSSATGEFFGYGAVPPCLHGTGGVAWERKAQLMAREVIAVYFLAYNLVVGILK